jgi:mRNA interferase MazF
LKKGQLEKLSDILVDQVRAIDNKRLLKKLGQLTKEQKIDIKANLRIVLDI